MSDRGHKIVHALHDMPEYQPILRRELRRRTMTRYGAFLSLLGLSPERLDKLKLMLDDMQGTQSDIVDAAVDRGYVMSDSEVQRKLSEYRREFDQQLRNFLTPGEYRQFNDFRFAETWQSMTMPELRAYLATRGVQPLSTEQEGALIAAYVETTQSVPDDPGLGAGASWRARNARLAEVAVGGLGPSQRQAVGGYMDFTNGREQMLARLLHPENPDNQVVTVRKVSSN